MAGIECSGVSMAVSVEVAVAFFKDTRALDLAAGATNKGVQVAMLDEPAENKPTGLGIDIRGY